MVGHRYVEAGLPGIVLLGGRIVDWDGTRILRVGELQGLVALVLARRPVPIDGAALRFLRTHLGCDPTDFAGMVGIPVRKLDAMEDGRRRVAGPVDCMARLLAIEAVEGAVAVGKEMARLTALDVADPRDEAFRHGSCWRHEPA